jgi:hypothetical protein
MSMGRNMKDLSKHVEAEIHHSNGEVEYIYSPFPVEARWPGVFVDSSSFRNLPVPEKFHQQGVAYLQAAALLCEAAGKAGNSLRWSQGSVCYYCLNIAMELFLKACIQKSNGGAAVPTHEIPKLLESYRAILPEQEFQFVTWWDRSWADIERHLGIKIAAEIDRHPDQLYRYGADRLGKGSAGIQNFSPDYFLGYVTYLEDIWKLAWDKVSNAEAQFPLLP